jgi:pimeloyl-ACP methyl ester carboxylesterase
VANIPEARYATTEDGVSLAFQTVGDGPVDLVFELEGWGNVEVMWELPQLAELFERLSQFSRLVLHDRRGTGLSGGDPSFPNLETRARDLLTVLDSIRSGRVALFGNRTAGAALALFAVTYPDRVASLVWFQAVATRRWSPEYPWGMTPDEHRRDTASTRDMLGNTALQREWLESAAPPLAGDEQLAARLARLDRHFMAPSTAVEWMNAESETDVRAVLPLLHFPTLVLDHEASPSKAAESRHVQALIPGAELALVSGDAYVLPFDNRAGIAEAVRQFVSREPVAQSADTVLATVLFTDIVARPSCRRRWATAPGLNSSAVITRSCVMRSNSGGASRTTRPATASTRPSTALRGRSDAHSLS